MNAALAIGLLPLLFAPVQTSGEQNVPRFPPHWWAPVPKEGAPAWEILPQQARPGEVILSKRNELGLLSNFAATPFSFRGQRYASLEGLWQMMLYPEGKHDPRATFPGLEWKHTRAQVAQMTSFEAKRAGELAEENMKKMGITWVTFEGKRIEYRPAAPGEHHRLIVAATWEKVKQNAEVRRVLLATGALVLKPDHHQEPNAPAAWRYFEIFTAIRSELQQARPASAGASPREGRIPVGNADLYFREIGRGRPIIVLHGGPDFDHSYLSPELDGLSDSFRLIYYDQRGRGRSADRVRPEDVTLASEIADLEKVREYFQLGSAAVLGHSWGALLALEYALRHPERVSHLILMNPAPASAEDLMLWRKERLEKRAADMDRLKAMRATAGYQEGDPDAVAAYYRIHFKGALKRPEHFDKMIARLRASFTKEGVLKARAIEDRLVDETWLSKGYDLLPKLESLGIPTLVLYGDQDFIPAAAAAHIAQAIPNARLVTLKGCGHFSYLECPGAVHKELSDFFRRTPARMR